MSLWLYVAETPPKATCTPRSGTDHWKNYRDWDPQLLWSDLE